MATPKQLAAVVAGTSSILLTQLFSFANTPNHPLKRATADSILSSILAMPASAQSNFSYVPPVAQNPKRSQGSGSRGCDLSLPEGLVTLLIPSKNYAAHTTSGHPSFSWHLSKPVSVPIRFVLMEPGVAKPLFVKQIDAPKTGINRLEMPEDLPELVPGRQYRWSVSLLCNQKRFSVNPFYYSWVQRVPTTPELAQKLAAAAKASDRASLYAGAGLWYDALAEISTARTANPNDKDVQRDFISLLEQVGLTKATEPQSQEIVINFRL